jgi:hypothetical protein
VILLISASQEARIYRREPPHLAWEGGVLKELRVSTCYVPASFAGPEVQGCCRPAAPAMSESEDRAQGAQGNLKVKGEESVQYEGCKGGVAGRGHPEF